MTCTAKPKTLYQLRIVVPGVLTLRIVVPGVLTLRIVVPGVLTLRIVVLGVLTLKDRLSLILSSRTATVLFVCKRKRRGLLFGELFSSTSSLDVGRYSESGDRAAVKT